MNKDNSSELEAGPRTAIFWILTGAYLGAALIGAWLLGYFDPKGKPLEPQEWGDVLAGVFAPLAFLWLIYASLAQRAELELQRIELRRNNNAQEAQQMEMARQANALAEQIKLAERQANALLEQHKQMERQADSTVAQGERISKEHYARYEPIFVLDGTSGDARPDLYVLNVGNDALDVEVSPPYIVRWIKSATGVFENISDIVPYWPKGSVVALEPPSGSIANDYPPITISLTRLDLSEIILSFAVDLRRARLAFNGRIERVEPAGITDQSGP